MKAFRAQREEVQPALRSAMAGAAVCEKVAARWSGNGTICPHCRAAQEDLEHRWWECPAWDGERMHSMTDGTTWQQLRNRIPRCVAMTGMLPVNQNLANSLLAHEALPEEPGLDMWSVTDEAVTVWTDGSLMDPLDSMIRRSGFAVVWPDGTVDSGRVPGLQTAFRAELYAAVRAVERTPTHVHLVTDCEGVADGIRVMAEVGEYGKEDLHGDLWRRIQARMHQGITAEWMPAHLTAVEATQAGVTMVNWNGNRIADEASKSAARRLRPPAAILSARMAAAEDLKQVQAVIGSVQLAVVRWAQGRPHQPPQRRAQPPAPQVNSFGIRAHATVQGGGRRCCMRCGRSVPLRPAVPFAHGCGGRAPGPRRGRLLLEAGAFDAALLALPLDSPALTEASLRGWSRDRAVSGWGSERGAAGSALWPD